MEFAGFGAERGRGNGARSGLGGCLGPGGLGIRRHLWRLWIGRTGEMAGGGGGFGVEHVWVQRVSDIFWKCYRGFGGGGIGRFQSGESDVFCKCMSVALPELHTVDIPVPPDLAMKKLASG